MPGLEPDLLKAFVAVAERGSFTAACYPLARSQSTVSLQIQRLESTVGKLLFVRTSHAVRLTAQGELLLGYARRLLALGEEAIAVAGGEAVPTTLRVGSVEDWATHVLPDRIAALQRLEPGVQVEVSTGSTAPLLARLGLDYDLVIGMQPVGTGRGQVLRRQQLVWVVPAEKPDLAADRPLPLALHPEGCLYRRWATQALDNAGIAWRTRYVSVGVGAVEAAVRSALAVSVFPSDMLGAGLEIAAPSLDLPPLPSVEVAAHLADTGPDAAKRLCQLLIEDSSRSGR